MLAGFGDWYVQVFAVRLLGILSLFTDISNESFRHGCLRHVTSVLLRAAFWRSAAPIDETIWDDYALETLLIENGMMAA